MRLHAVAGLLGRSPEAGQAKRLAGERLTVQACLLGLFLQCATKDLYHQLARCGLGDVPAVEGTGPDDAQLHIALESVREGDARLAGHPFQDLAGPVQVLAVGQLDGGLHEVLAESAKGRLPLLAVLGLQTAGQRLDITPLRKLRDEARVGVEVQGAAGVLQRLQPLGYGLAVAVADFHAA